MENKHPLSQKITSKGHEALRHYTPRNTTYGTLNGLHVRRPWWLEREYLRIDNGIYPGVTEVLQQINAATPGFAVHVSVQDKNLVAFTPDKAYGEADRQVHMSLARFLTKYYPFYSDVEIAEFQAEHLAELTISYELVSGEDIVATYRAKPGSDKIWACMSKTESSYTYGNPTVVYNTPGVYLALLKNAGGEVTARSLVYHASETDKRYIRATYGDAKLRKALERDGYKPGGWVGCKFNTVIARKEGDLWRVVCPYLDSMGSTASSEGSSVALIDGVLTGVTAEVAQRLRERFGDYAATYSSGTSGYISLKPIDSSSFQGVCFLSGKTYNTLTDELVEVWKDEASFTCLASEAGSLKYAYVLITDASGRRSFKRRYVAESAPTFEYDYQSYLDTEEIRKLKGFKQLSDLYYPVGERWTTWSVVIHTGNGTNILTDDVVYYMQDGMRCVLHSSEVPPTASRFQHGSRIYLDGAAEREYNGMMRLDPVWYPDSQDWHRYGVVKSEDGRNFLEIDAGRVWTGTNMSLVHKSTITKQHVKLHNFESEPLWAVPDATGVHKTPSGRKVVPCYHEVREIGFTGTYEFKRNLKQHMVAGDPVWLPYGEKPTPDMLERVVLTAIEDEMRAGLNIHHALAKIVKDRIDHYMMVDGAYIYRKTSTVQWSDVYKVCKDYYVGKDIAAVLNRFYERFMAEANAVDYNLEFVGPPAPFELNYEPVATGTIGQVVESIASWMTAAEETLQPAPVPTTGTLLEVFNAAAGIVYPSASPWGAATIATTGYSTISTPGTGSVSTRFIIAA